MIFFNEGIIIIIIIITIIIITYERFACQAKSWLFSMYILAMQVAVF